VASSLSAVPQHSTEVALGRPGVPAQRLLQSDQLVLREIGDPVQSAADLAVDSLNVTGEKACALLSQPGSFPTLNALYLTRCRDDDLIRLADVLQTAPRPGLSITLDGNADVYVSVIGFRAIAGTTLALLHIKGLPISPDVAAALALSRSPVSISLPFQADGITNVYKLTQINTLTSLDAGNHTVSAACIGPLSAHPSLTALRFNMLPSVNIRAILASQPLRSFSVDSIMMGFEAEAFSAFADSRTLKSLTVGSVHDPEALVTLSRNTTLTSVDLRVHRSASVATHHLTKLPALDTLAISYVGITLMPDDVRALCAKPLSSLSFSALRIDSAALELIVRAKAASLSVNSSGQLLTDTIVDALIANERISALTVLHRIIDERRALRLITSPTLEKLTVEFESDARRASAEHFQRTWVAAGKSLDNLWLSVVQAEGDLW
jgi:hypothetical protein